MFTIYSFNIHVHINILFAVSIVSSNTLLGTPTESYAFGAQYAFIGIGSTIAGIIIAFSFVPLIYPVKLISVHQVCTFYFNPFLHGRHPLLAILSLGQKGEPYSCTMYTEFLLEVLVSRCFVQWKYLTTNKCPYLTPDGHIHSTRLAHNSDSG